MSLPFLPVFLLFLLAQSAITLYLIHSTKSDDWAVLYLVPIAVCLWLLS